MLKAFQNKPLEVSADKETGGYFACLEVWRNDSTLQAVPVQPIVKRLQDIQIEEWAWQRGSFKPTATSVATSNATKIASRIRILFAEPKSNHRHAIPEMLTKGNILDALDLPGHTFSSLQLDSGIYSSHCRPEGTTVKNCTSLAFIFRTPQLKNCSIGGLSVSYNLETNTTTALILGYAFDLKALHDGSSTTPEGLERFLQQLVNCDMCWSHPLLLPCVFLVEHAQRVQKYAVEILSRRVVLVEHSIGVTKTGRSGIIEYDFPGAKEHANDQILFKDGHMLRQNAKTLVGTINELSTTLIFAERSPQWDLATIEFLYKLLEHERLQKVCDIANNTFRETLDYLRTYCKSSSELVRSSRARVDLQLSILYTSIAQDDGQTSARLATDAGKDSTSMKIIALITAAYLPGTFVATLFSMDMFDWQSTTVSSSFYIYWAVTVPLTIITISGWALWWGYEKQRFERDVQQAKTNEPFSKSQKRFRW